MFREHVANLHLKPKVCNWKPQDGGHITGPFRWPISGWKDLRNGSFLSIPSVVNSAYEWMSPPLRNGFFLSPVTSEEIETEKSNLRIGKAVGPSSMPVSILKILKGALSGPLQIIFNASLLTGIVPERFKLARVRPVFKKGSQVSLNKYRNISYFIYF